MKGHIVFIGAGLALLLAGCGGDPEPTPTPTKTPAAAAAPTSTAAPAHTPAPLAAAATQTPATTTPLADAIAGAVVAKVADDAVAFVLEKGTANVTANQLSAALVGVIGRLREWVAGSGGETALVDCQALVPGVIDRADNKAPLEALLAACESGDPAQVSEALAAFAGIMP